MDFLRPSPIFHLSSWLRRISVSVITCMLMLGGITDPGSASAAATITPEYQLKAVFLFNFTQFVEWPPQAFADANSPLIIGVLGSDPFGSYLDDTVRGETVNGRPLQVQRYASIDQVNNCHVLFISRAEASHLPEIFSKLKGRRTLTVGENEGFVNAGGMIRFLTVSNKIRLRIGLESAQQAGLVLSSKLLRPADVVRNGAE